MLAVGEFVDPGQELMRVHGDGRATKRAPRGVRVGDERTIEQDPAFAMRIVVDTAIRALSPAVNDPTTAVQAIDVLEVLVPSSPDATSTHRSRATTTERVRLVWHSPDWEDVLDLAFDEIRAYGASAMQVCRRLRAALEDLRATSAPSRAHRDRRAARAARRRRRGCARRRIGGGAGWRVSPTARGSGCTGGGARRPIWRSALTHAALAAAVVGIEGERDGRSRALSSHSSAFGGTADRSR